MIKIPIKIQMKRFYRRLRYKDNNNYCQFKGISDVSPKTRITKHRNGSKEQTIECPNILSFYGNTTETATFFKNIDLAFSNLKKKNIFTINFANLQHIGILECVLLNNYIKIYLLHETCSISMGGSKPKKDILNFLIYTFVFKPLENNKNITLSYKYSNLEETTKQYIQLEGNKRDLNSKDKCVLELINFFSSALKEFGYNDIIDKNKKNLINALTEIIGNAQEHQSVDKPKKARWQIAGYYDKETKQCDFVILNFNSIIYKTLENNEDVKKFIKENKNIHNTLNKKLSMSSNELLTTILSLQDGISSKKAKEGKNSTRGKGLMSFLDFINRVSNDSKITIISGKSILKIDFLKCKICENSMGRSYSFNSSNSLSDLPDINMVGYLPNSFNGTFITGRFPIE